MVPHVFNILHLPLSVGWQFMLRYESPPNREKALKHECVRVLMLSDTGYNKDDISI